MIKLKDRVNIEKLIEYGFLESKHHYSKKCGALEIYCDKETRKIYGIGFYTVGDRIVLRQLRDWKMDNIVDIT